MKNYTSFNPTVSEEQEGNYIAMDIKATDEETVEIESSTGKGAKTLEPGDRFLVWRVQDADATMRVSVTGGDEDRETTYKASGLTLESKDAVAMPVSAPSLGPAPFSMPAPAVYGAVGASADTAQGGTPVEDPEDSGQKAPVGAPAPETGTTPPDGEDAPDGGDSGQGAPVQSVPESISIPDTLSIVDGHFVRDDLLAMERKDMEALAEELGVDVSKCRNKGAIADILAAIELDIDGAGDEDDETPPDIDVEGPVV